MSRPDAPAGAGSETTVISLEPASVLLFTDLEKQAMDEASETTDQVHITDVAQDNRDAWTVTSQSSTVEYQQEAYETYKDRVLQLCQLLWSLEKPEAFTIERMKGGGYNRIIRITVAPSPTFPLSVRWFTELYQYLFGPRSKDSWKKTKLTYILRVPRFWREGVAYDRANIKFAQLYTNLPVPEIVKYDLTSENPLESPYSIQKCIPGQDAEALWKTLNDAQKISLAQEVGKVLLQFQKVIDTRPGTIVPGKNFDFATTGHGDYLIEKFCVPLRYHEHSYKGERTAASQSQSVLAFIIDQCQRWNALDYAISDIGFPELWDDLAKIATDMDKAGLFDNMWHALTHLDFAPRNLMITVVDEHTVKVTGVLDWDDAVFAPEFMGCSPPIWLWNGGDDEDMDEFIANNTPEDPFNQACKRVFEETVGPAFLERAYKEEYIFARKLVYFATRGLWEGWEHDAAKELIQHWKQLHPDFVVSEFMGELSIVKDPTATEDSDEEESSAEEESEDNETEDEETEEEASDEDEQT